MQHLGTVLVVAVAVVLVVSGCICHLSKCKDAFYPQLLMCTSFPRCTMGMVGVEEEEQG